MDTPILNSFGKFLRWMALLAVLLVGFRADQASKKWAQRRLRYQPGLLLIDGALEFRYAENPAIAFSMLHDMPDRKRTTLILVLTGFAMVGLAVLIWKWRGAGMMKLIPLSIILAGALGNIQDRLTNGFVVDFIWVHWREAWSFPIFNVADSMISVGATFLVLESFLKARQGNTNVI